MGSPSGNFGRQDDWHHLENRKRNALAQHASLTCAELQQKSSNHSGGKIMSHRQRKETCAKCENPVYVYVMMRKRKVPLCQKHFEEWVKKAKVRELKIAG